jgi:MFS family permease
MTNTKNYRLLVGIAFMQGMVFYGPVATLYRRAYGLDIQGLFLIESISWSLTIALEAPWGRFADRYGYRLTLLIGNGIFLGSKFVFAAASGFSGFLFERILLSLAISALSGCIEAMVYRSAGAASAEKAFGRWNAASGAGLFMSALASPLLYSASLRMTAYGTIVPYASSFVCSLFLVDVPESAAARPGSPGLTHGLRAAGVALVMDRRLLVFLMVAAVSGEAAHAATVFLAPLQYERAGIPAALFKPLSSIVQNERVSGTERATVLSLNAMVIEMTAAVVNVGVGTAAAGGLPPGFGVLSALVAAMALVLMQLNRTK